ncbi:unnamed protein product [Mytilus edulis]|uniref:Endonuclease/exonuclease/phosphatase domain-containing protein n=1 Tax=Mytilus edulis TaxID=6550 RepID=A0A8S3QQV2_MYTED|nr:unnamed protein product [Mytilus edulis]
MCHSKANRSVPSRSQGNACNSSKPKVKKDLKFCFWNVGGIVHGGMNKLDDDMFLSEIKAYDIILLAETHIGYNTPLSIDGYKYYPVCRPISGNAQSIYTKNLSTDILQLLEKDILHFKSKGDVLLCGDFNARCGNLLDFVSSDSTDHLPISNDNYPVDFNLNVRNSRDTTVDTRGKELIELCLGNQIRLLNGRTLGDSLGKYTCYNHMGTSVVDYLLASDSLMQNILYFNVSTFNPTLSDCHCKLSWKILSHHFLDIIPQPNSKVMGSKFKWQENSPQAFQLALQDKDSKNLISHFDTSSDINELAVKLNEILLTASKKMFEASFSTEKSSRKIYTNKKVF